ncbi:hypothetical protein MBLNU459_g2115t1 [Dothideomycetes sp. NU459]
MRNVILLSVLLCLGVAFAADTAHTVSIFAWPVGSPKSQQLAQITYGYPSLNYSIKSYTPPSLSAAGEVVRIGFSRPGSEDGWSGIATSSANFGPDRSKKLRLHLDASGELYHVGFSAIPNLSTSGDSGHKEDLKVELVEEQNGPRPHLNKPVVVNAEGKVDDGKEPEKTFFQKYWWAIAAFILIQVAMGGGDK